MISEQRPAIRKRRLEGPGAPANSIGTTTLNEIDLAAHAMIHFSSEDPEHPIEHALDGSSGRGASRWLSAHRDTTEQIVLEFDEPRDVSRIEFQVEEAQLERTQEVRAEYSRDGGRTYRQVFVQEYTFSPNGSTYQCESLNVQLSGVTHLRFNVMPNKGGSGKASLTLLRLYS